MERVRYLHSHLRALEHSRPSSTSDLLIPVKCGEVVSQRLDIIMGFVRFLQ